MPEFKRLIAFGDSYSDNGHIGGHGFDRLAEGPVWTEHLAAGLGLELDCRAWCGARSDRGNATPDAHGNSLEFSGLAWQIEHFQPQEDTAGSLFSLWIGINDVCDGQADPGTVAGNIRAALQRLAAKGALRLLFFNIPDITLAPAYGLDPEYAPLKEKVSASVREVNRAVEAAVFGPGGFCQAHPELACWFFDAQAFFAEYASNGHFANTGGTWQGSKLYPHPDGYLWYDQWHPTTAMHGLIARRAAEILAGEPRCAPRGEGC